MFTTNECKSYAIGKIYQANNLQTRICFVYVYLTYVINFRRIKLKIFIKLILGERGIANGFKVWEQRNYITHILGCFNENKLEISSFIF